MHASFCWVSFSSFLFGNCYSAPSCPSAVVVVYIHAYFSLLTGGASSEPTCATVLDLLPSLSSWPVLIKVISLSLCVCVFMQSFNTGLLEATKE